jgi:radical SAM superfamily enzyme
MEQEKLKLKQTAEQLAEKYEDTKDKQEEITKRQDIGCIIYFTRQVSFYARDMFLKKAYTSKLHKSNTEVPFKTVYFLGVRD